MKRKNSIIETLEKENTALEEDIRRQGAKLCEVIGENDRLTMTYEPYRPPGDEHEGLDFYGLIEENDELTQSVLDKIEIIKEQDEEIRVLRNQLFVAQYPKAPVEKKKYPKAGAISFDFWPLSDWFRLNGHRFDQGRSFQLNIGPIRVDWFLS